MGGEERRVFDRVDVRLRVNFRRMDAEESLDYIESGDFSKLEIKHDENTTTFENETKDISLGGLSLGGDLTILGDQELKRGDDLAVEILIPGLLQSIKAIAVVVWARRNEEEGNRHEIGLMFKGIADEDLDRLRDVMMRFQKGS